MKRILTIPATVVLLAISFALYAPFILLATMIEIANRAVLRICSWSER